MVSAVACKFAIGSFYCWFTCLKVFDPPIDPDISDKDSHQWAEFDCTIEELIAALLGSQLVLCYLSVPAVEL